MDWAKLGFTEKELKEISISTLALAFIFFYPGYSMLWSIGPSLVAQYLMYVFIVFFAFIPHELAHKFVSMRYGCVSVYQMWPRGLKFAMLLAIITNGTFVIAAPGAVMIYTSYRSMFGIHQVHITPKQNAYISLAGPVTNIIVAMLAIPLIPVFPLALGVAYVCSFLAFFNMLPIPPLDGSKVFAWNKSVWLAVTMVAYLMQGMF